MSQHVAAARSGISASGAGNGGGCARSLSTKPDDWLLQVASRLLAKDGVFAGFQRTLRATF